MLSKIILENFFSFRHSTAIALNPDINILLGINGSGKSNFLKAIQLLYESIVGNGFEQLFLGAWGGFDTVANFNQDEKDYIKLTFEFDKNAVNRVDGFQFGNNPIYEVAIFRVGGTSYYLQEKLYSERMETDDGDLIFLEMKNLRGVISTREEGEVGLQKYPSHGGQPTGEQLTFKSTEPVLRQISDPERFYPVFTLKRALEEISVYYYFDTTFSSVIRQPSSYTIATKLASDGQNLMTLLNRIKNNHPMDYENIEEAVKKINPYFKDINFDLIGSKLYLVLREKHLSKSISIEQISEGTLSYLLLLSILFNPERGKLVCIDEPETSLHPDMINTISNAIKYATKDTQMIVTTHSPLLLNLFEIDDVLIFEKNEQNETEVNVKDVDDFDEWMDDFLVGQAWLQGLIGGKRW